MRTYNIRGPCPELAITLARAMEELAPGEQALFVTRWRYVAEDMRSAAPSMGFEVLSVTERGGNVEILVRKRA